MLRLDYSSSKRLQLSNALALAYYQAGRWQDTATTCEQMMCFGIPALIQSRYYLTDSLYEHGQHIRAFVLVKEWKIIEITCNDVIISCS